MNVADPAAGDRSGVQRAGDDQRHRRGPPGWLTTPAPWSSSMPSTTPRIGWSMSGRWAATSSPARRTSSTARTSACCTASTTSLQGLDVPKLQPAPETVPERLETGTQNHEGIVGAAAAVEFLASLATGPTRRDTAPGRVRRPSSVGRRPGGGDSGTGLTTIEGVRLYGPTPSQPRTPTVSFTVGGLPCARGVPPPGRDRGSSPRTATSTRRRSSSGSVWRARGWCESAAPATRRRRRSTGSLMEFVCWADETHRYSLALDGIKGWSGAT